LKFLYIRAGQGVDDVAITLKKMGHEVTAYAEHSFYPDGTPDEAYEKLEKLIRTGRYDFLISYLFFGRVSDICQENGLRYIAWVYDSPLVTLFEEAAKNEVNHIFIFDKTEYERLLSLEIPHLYYMPMAACTSRIGAVKILPEHEKRFSHEVSFVGDLYDDNAYDKVFPHLEKEQQALLQQEVTASLNDWSASKSWPKAPAWLIELCRDKKLLNEEYAHGMDPATFIAVAVICRKQAQVERASVLSMASAFGDTHLYTRGEPSYLDKRIHIHGQIDYYTDMTRVFNLSKISLNITIPSIETGLPQRIWDIMGSGGFCLTNHQAEIEDFFKIGEEIETFKSLEELAAKVKYYLTHEDVRQRILINGFEKVMNEHTYEQRLNEMIEKAGR